MIKSTLQTLLLQERIALDSKAVDRLKRFTALLLEWNAIHNLTGAKNIQEVHENIIDALYPLTFIKPPRTLLDVGTGAGFPGLVLAIALEDTFVTLCEPIKKRASFLRYAAATLHLSRVRVASTRVEQHFGKSYELITSRAVGELSLLLRLTTHLSCDSTSYLLYKGSRVFDEVVDINKKINYTIKQRGNRNYLYIKERV